MSTFGGLPRLIVPLVVFISIAALADDDKDFPHSKEEPLGHVHGSHAECPLPKSTQDVVECAREWHPEVRRIKYALEQAQALPDVAKQIPNPEVEVQSVHGSLLGDQLMQTQISLVQPIELGGKRSGRIKQAEARQKQSEADLKQTQSEVIVQTVLKLHRARQLEKEKHTLDEAIEAYAKLIRQHKSKPRLPPEQEVSLSVFEMAKSDYEIRRSVVLQEEREIEHYFHVATGHSLKEIAKVLPKAPLSWPKLTEESEIRLVSPRSLRLLADQEFAHGELESAQGGSWPEFRLGPMVQLQTEGAFKSQLYGIQLNLSLPLFNVNGAGRAYASKGIALADRSIELLRSEEAHERAELVRVYQAAVTALEGALPLDVVSKKHHRVEALALRGIVSSALIIEAHRQLVELEKSRHERELKAMDSMWNVYRIDGRVFKETL